MKMILKRMSIENFKGCKERVIDFSNRTSIKGVNGSGKTTIADAVMWVLFNKDSAGATQFDIRPRDEKGIDIDFIEIKVELVLDVDGKEITIVKTQKQNWVKKRGQEEQTFQGNTNSYEINTIPKSEKEYKAHIEELVPEEVFRFVSNTNAFMDQSPADRRKTLFELVSDVSDIDVLATDKKFDPLRDQLEQFTSEEILSRDKKALSEYKKELKEIPARIDEVSKTIVERDYTEEENKLADLRKQLEAVEDDTSNAKVYEEVNNYKSEIAKLNGELQDLERNANADNNKKRSEIQNKIIDIDQQINSATRSKQNSEGNMRGLESDISTNENKLETLGNDYKSLKAEDIEADATVCPTCQREYEADKKESIVADFQKNKDDRLMQINLKGKDIADSIKKDKEKVELLKAEISECETKLVELERNKELLQKELEMLPEKIDITSTEEYRVIQKQIETAQSNLEKASETISNLDAKKQAINDKKRTIQSEIDQVNQVLASKGQVENAKNRVKELQEEQKRISQDIATTEKELYLLEEFEKAKVNLLSDKINSHFKIVKWKLFERQINGGYRPVCEPMVNGQAYSSALNSGHKILAELDIIQALQKIYDVSVPVFLDNAERINNFNIPEMDCQLVTLSVTEDPVLKVEVM